MKNLLLSMANEGLMEEFIEVIRSSYNSINVKIDVENGTISVDNRLLSKYAIDDLFKIWDAS